MKRCLSKSQKIVRPLNNDLSKKVLFKGKIPSFLQQFQHDQIDFNFKNPNVLIYFLEVIKFYLDSKYQSFEVIDAV